MYPVFSDSKKVNDNWNDMCGVKNSEKIRVSDGNLNHDFPDTSRML